MSLRKAAEAVLEAWDWDWSEPRNEALRERMEALRQALAQPEQRPVGTYEGVMETMLSLRKGTLEQQQIYTHMKDKLLYTAPPNIEAAVLTEREACARLVEADGLARGDEGLVFIKAAGRIRARGEK